MSERWESIFSKNRELMGNFNSADLESLGISHKAQRHFLSTLNHVQLSNHLRASNGTRSSISDGMRPGCEGEMLPDCCESQREKALRPRNSN